MSFHEWRRENGYKSYNELVDDMMVAGKTLTDIEDAWDEIREGYMEYCEDEEIDEVWD